MVEQAGRNRGGWEIFAKVGLLTIDSYSQKKKIVHKYKLVQIPGKHYSCSLYVMQKTNFYWYCIFYTVFFILYFIFYHYHDKESFAEPCLFYWGYKPWGILHWRYNAFSIGTLSHWDINHAFSIGSMFIHWTQFKFLRTVFRIAYAICESNHLKVFLEICVH